MQESERQAQDAMSATPEVAADAASPSDDLAGGEAAVEAEVEKEIEAEVDAIVAQHAVTSSPLRRRVYLGIGCLLVVFAIIGIWVPGWPTVSWAVPAAFFFSLSSERLFRWSLTNRFFGGALRDYYTHGKTIPRHAKWAIVAFIGLMSLLSAYFVFRVSYPADPGYGPAAILAVGLFGMWYVGVKVGTRA